MAAIDNISTRQFGKHHPTVTKISRYRTGSVERHTEVAADRKTPINPNYRGKHTKRTN